MHKAPATGDSGSPMQHRFLIPVCSEAVESKHNKHRASTYDRGLFVYSMNKCPSLSTYICPSILLNSTQVE